MRKALPILVTTLALTIPHPGSAAEREAPGAGAAPPGVTGISQPPVAQRPGGAGQAWRGGPPHAGGPQQGRGKAKGHKRGNRRYGGSVRHAPRPPAVAYPYRPPIGYRAPHYDVRRTYLGGTGVSLSFLYSATWGEVFVEFGNPVPASAYVIPAPIAVPPSYRRTRHSLRIPPGHLPPPGFCRVWYPGRPPGHQPPPTDCDTAYWYAPEGSYIVYGG